MKRYLGFSVVALFSALVFGGLSGCTATEDARSTTVVHTSGERPAEVQPKPSRRTRLKTTTPNPITVSKVVPTPSAAPKTKRVKPTVMKGNVVVGTTVPFSFGIDAAFWPEGVEEVNATAKCFQITSLSNGSTPSVSLNSTALAVFSGTTSKPMTLTPEGPTQINLNFPTSTAGMQVIVIVTGTGEDQYGDPFSFSGAEILVVDP